VAYHPRIVRVGVLRHRWTRCRCSRKNERLYQRRRHGLNLSVLRVRKIWTRHPRGWPSKMRYLVGYLVVVASCSDPSSTELVPPSPFVPASIDCCPSWSADGERVWYSHRGIDSIYANGGYTVDPDSVGIWITTLQTARGKLALSQAVTTVELSPDGDQVAFGSAAHIFRASVSGDSVLQGTVVQLTSAGRNFFPAWSPSGLEIAFDNTACAVPTAPDACGVLVMDSDGSNIRLIAPGRMPDWSPSGTEIAYVGADGDLYSIAYPGPGVPRRVLGFTSDISYPRYSNTGSFFAFVVWEFPRFDGHLVKSIHS
jgi:hypothetical protein